MAATQPHLLTNPNCQIVDQLERPLPPKLRNRLAEVRNKNEEKLRLEKAKKKGG